MYRNTWRNVSGRINNSEVVATDVYDNNIKKQIKRMIPLLINIDNLCNFLAKQLIITRTSDATRGWM